MSIEGIFPIGDGMLDVDEQLLKGLLVPHDINDIYDVEQTPFARGKFAAVRRAIHKNSGVHFAAKFLKRRRRAQSSDKEIKHEIAVLMLCDGAENIVKLNAVHESRSDTALLLELATGGELQTFLDNEECLSETQARYCMREVLKGLEYLHERSIAHLDLKPQNILLTGENIEDGLKLCDFGISRVVAEGSNVREIVGTPDYVAPEVLQYEPLSLLTDIWSVGVLAYVLLTGFSPFGGDTKQETFLNISQCALEFPDKLFGGVSAAAIDFIRRALRIKPNDRMTAAGCLEHIWLKDECAIGRQVYNKLAQIATDSEDEEEEDDDEDDENVVDVDDDDVENKILDDKLVENLENIVKQVNDDIDIVKNGSHVQNMESSDTEVESLPINNTTNGRAHKYQNGTSSIVAASTTNSKQTNGIMTTTTTAVHTVPAARATTIPLCTHIHQKHYQQQQQQQQIQNLIAGRRHSSDANKENTFLATKKIVPTTNNGGKKSNGLVMLQQTTTATIIIGASNASLSDEIDDDGNYEVDADEEEVAEEEEDDEAENAQLVCNGNSNCINGSSLFPDAPTTPKVIRKAPTTDTSPTSVKALVKKFQLEGGNQQNTLNNSTITTTAVAAAVLTPTPVSTTNTTTTIVLPTSGKSASTLKQQQQQQNSSRKSTTTLIVNGYKNNGATTLNTNGCLRRFSEPHVNGKTTTKLTSTSSMTASKPPSPASYKSTCVYCLTCGATSNNTSNGQRSADSPTKSTTNGCRHSTVTAVTTSSPTKTSSIPLYQHHHNHHQHNHNHNHSIHHHAHALHHHHELLVVAKNGGATSATSNLSVDQGIIC